MINYQPQLFFCAGFLVAINWVSIIHRGQMRRGEMFFFSGTPGVPEPMFVFVWRKGCYEFAWSFKLWLQVFAGVFSLFWLFLRSWTVGFLKKATHPLLSKSIIWFGGEIDAIFNFCSEFGWRLLKVQLFDFRFFSETRVSIRVKHQVHVFVLSLFLSL